MTENKNRCAELMAKIDNKERPSFDEFIELIGFGLEMQFYYKKRKFGTSHFDGFEFYEWDIEDGYQNYDTLEDFAKKINIHGMLVKDIWNSVSRINFAD